MIRFNYELFENHLEYIVKYWKDAVDWENGGIHFLRRKTGQGICRQETKCLLMHCRQLYNYSVGYEMKISDSKEVAEHLYSTLDSLFLFNETIEVFSNHIYNKNYNVTLELLNDDMTVAREQEYSSTVNAHSLQWIGFLYEVQLLTEKTVPFLAEYGKKLARASLERGFTKNGSFKNHYYLKEKTAGPTSSYWGQTEAVLGALYAAGLFDASFFSNAEKLTEFYFNYYIDHEFGGIFTEISSDGVILRRDKGFPYKCDFHSLRMCEKIIEHKLLA